MRENPDERRSQSHREERLPYDQQDWNRRLAEARTRRAASLQRRDRQPGAAAAPSERLAAAWDGDRDALAAVTSMMAAEAAQPPLASVEPGPKIAVAQTEPAVDALRGPASFRPAVTLLTGCLIGASLTGLLFLASGEERPLDGIVTSAEAVPAAGATAPPVERVQGLPEQPSGPRARVTVKMLGDGAAARARADDAAGGAEAAAREPAAEPASVAQGDGTRRRADPAAVAERASPVPRQPAVPDMINATQVLAPEDVIPKTPGSIERVTVLVPRSVSRAGRDEAAALLSDAGWPAREPATSPFTVSRTHVRYYHESDRAGAEDLAALFSAEARDFTSYSPSPERGMVELWLAGRAPQRQSQQTPSLARFLGRLAAALELRD